MIKHCRPCSRDVVCIFDVHLVYLVSSFIQSPLHPIWKNREESLKLTHSSASFVISGLLIAVRKECFRVICHRELLFNDCGDRVAQLLHVELAGPYSPSRNNDTRQEILIVNTHLLFPHDSSLSLVRLNQVNTFSSPAVLNSSSSQVINF